MKIFILRNSHLPSGEFTILTFHLLNRSCFQIQRHGKRWLSHSCSKIERDVALLMLKVNSSLSTLTPAPVCILRDIALANNPFFWIILKVFVTNGFLSAAYKCAQNFFILKNVSFLNLCIPLLNIKLTCLVILSRSLLRITILSLSLLLYFPKLPLTSYNLVTFFTSHWSCFAKVINNSVCWLQRSGFSEYPDLFQLKC